MSLAALTFSQEIQKTLVQALATAVSVTVLGGLVATRVSQRWELRREDFELRAGLLDRATRCAQTMFVTCQHVRRVNSDNPGSSGEPARREARTLLDTTYRRFSSEAEAIETVLGARYGIRWVQAAGDGAGEAFLRWHQVSDLLTLYYFNLCGDFRLDVLPRNSTSEKKLHSGLDATSMIADPRRPQPAELKAMRDAIRRAYNGAVPKVARAILDDLMLTRGR
jgi:hypothetical protein